MPDRQANSWMSRLLWRYGVKLKPQYFCSFRGLAWGNGLYFATVWGVFMHYWQWKPQGLDWQAQVTGAVLAGAIFGVFMAYIIRRRAKSYDLTAWDDL